MAAKIQVEVGYRFGLVGRDVMACTASNLAPIAKAVIHVPEAGGRTRWCVTTNRYDIDSKHNGQNKNGMHQENDYMCIGEEVEDGAHCLGVVCWMKRVQKERAKDGTLRIRRLPTAKTTLGELVLDQEI